MLRPPGPPSGHLLPAPSPSLGLRRSQQEEGGAPDLELNPDYLGGLTAARAALGLDDALPDLAASPQDRQARWF